MRFEGEQYLDPKKAALLGFNGSFVVLHIAGYLDEERKKLLETFIIEVSDLEEIAINPPSHMTLCWVQDSNHDIIVQLVEEWTVENLPIDIQTEPILGRFSSPPRLPFIAIRNSEHLATKRRRLTEKLSESLSIIEEENQPHLSLFYVLDPTKWSAIEDQVESLSARIEVPSLVFTGNQVDVVSFNSDGSQQVTSLL